MPLLTSPISGEPMQQIHRYGVEFDVCPTSGGIWLDKGELEKIMAAIQNSLAQEQQHMAQYVAPEQKQKFQERYDVKPYKQGKHKYKKKKSAFSEVFDLFDFQKTACSDKCAIIVGCYGVEPTRTV